MKQTAVEWLIARFHYEGFIGTFCSEERIKAKRDVMIEIIEQAKEMEKEQMRTASCPYVGGWEEDEFDYWYNEKYNNNESKTNI
jgi:hypothetical protein